MTKTLKNLGTAIDFNSSSSLPPLETTQGSIIRGDTKEPVQLKGATSNAFRYGDLGYKNADEITKKLQVIKDWGGNSVNLYLDPQLTQRKLSDLDKVINWADKNSLYVSLQPIPSKTPDGSPDIQGKLFQSFMPDLAKRYKDKTNVVYGLWAEPYNYENQDWIPMAQNLTDKIRQNNPQAPVTLSGQYAGRDLNYLKDHPFNRDNVIYDFHDYPQAWSNPQNLPGYGNGEADTSKSQWMEGKYPVMQGEFGKYYAQDFSSPQDLSFIQQKVTDANKKNQSYFGYGLDESGGLGLFNGSAPSPRGQIFQEDLKKNPPTQFNSTKTTTLPLGFSPPKQSGQSGQLSDKVSLVDKLHQYFNSLL